MPEPTHRYEVTLYDAAGHRVGADYVTADAPDAALYEGVRTIHAVSAWSYATAEPVRTRTAASPTGIRATYRFTHHEEAR